MSARSQRTLDVDEHPVKVSNIEKVLYPADGIVKAAVIDYYRNVARVMWPHLRGRPLVLRRFPDGIDRDGFFQKEASDHFPDWLRTVEVPRQSGRGAGQQVVRHVVCDDEASLVYLANQACLEFHPFTSTADAVDHPDLLVVDLDPPDGLPAAELRAAARRVRDEFERLGLAPFLQATGGSGFHVTAPLDATSSFAVVLPLARALARRLAAAEPERFTDELRKDRRGGRIFLDVNRNAYGQTAVAPYSLRARPGAPAATPLDWSELSRARPNQYGLRNLPRRMARKADPWAGLHERAVSAVEVRERLDAATAAG